MSQRPLLAVLGIFTVLGVGMLLIRLIQEPRFEGENFEYWARAIESNDDEVRAKAYTAIGALMREHPQARARFLIRLEQETSDLPCQSAFTVLARKRQIDGEEVGIVVKVASRSQSTEVKKAAFGVLGLAGQEAVPAIPLLTRGLENPALVDSTLIALRSIGKNASAASPALMAFAKSEKCPADKIDEALGVLRSIDPDYSTKAAEIAKAIMDGSNEQRQLKLANTLSYREWQRSDAANLVANSACDLLEKPGKIVFALNLLEDLGGNRVASTRLAKYLLGLSKEQAAGDLTRQMVRYLANFDPYMVRDSMVPSLIARIEQKEDADKQIAALWILQPLSRSGRAAIPAIKKAMAENPMNQELQRIGRLVLVAMEAQERSAD